MVTSIKGARIWLSGAIEEEATDDEKDRIKKFLTAFALEVFRRGGRLIHGSHPSVRGTLLEAAATYKKDTGDKAGLVLIVSRYFSKSPKEYEIDLDAWNELTAEPIIQTREGIGQSDQEIRDASLEILRKTLLAQSNAIVAVGGKWWDIASEKAGVPKEIDLAAQQHLPLFLLGGLGGATHDYLKSKQELLRNCTNGLTEDENLKLAAETDDAPKLAQQTDVDQSVQAAEIVQPDRKPQTPSKLAQTIVDQIARLPLRETDLNSGRPFRILSLDGGGIRGVYTAAVLAYFEETLNYKVIDHFDLIAGTSTGGLLAIGLGLGLSAKDMLAFYKSHGPEIFPTENAVDRLWHSFRHWFGSKFDQQILKEKLEDAYGATATLDVSATRLVIPTYDSLTDSLWVYRTPHGPFKNNQKGHNAVEVALATAAAPTYFDPFNIKGTVTQIKALDGGVWANNPGSVAISEAVEYLQIPIERITMLSIGTTHTIDNKGQPFSLDKDHVAKIVGIGGGRIASIAAKLFWKDTPIRGKIGWIANIADFLMKTQAQTANRVCLALLGGGRFIRIDSPKETKGLDDVAAIDSLAALGEADAINFANAVHLLFLNGIPVDSWK